MQQIYDSELVGPPKPMLFVFNMADKIPNRRQATSAALSESSVRSLHKGPILVRTLAGYRPKPINIT